MRTLLLAASLAAAATALPMLAQGATDYPTKPVRILVPLAPGGGVDTITRKLAEKLGPALKQPIIVENKPGAAGTLAIDAVAKASPDGYTIALVAGSMIAINPHVLKKMPYDTAKDLVPVAQVGTTPLVLLVNANNPAKTLKEFFAAAKAKPKEASFGSYGNASVGHLLGEALGKAAGVDLVHVPYKGATPAITDLIGGQVSAVIADFGSARAHIGQGGKLRALALSADKRVAAYPNVPTFGEEGLPQLNSMNGWLGVCPCEDAKGSCRPTVRGDRKGARRRRPEGRARRPGLRSHRYRRRSFRWHRSPRHRAVGGGDQERRRDHAGLTRPRVVSYVRSGPKH